MAYSSGSATVTITAAPVISSGGQFIDAASPQIHQMVMTNPPAGLWARCSQQATCTHCNAQIHTQTKFVNGTMTHLACFGLFWLTCCCCCIPYFVDSLKDVEHSCPNCEKVVGYNHKKF